MKNKEFVLWGIPTGQNVEELLLTKINGLYITDRKMAEQLQERLIGLGCTNVRIQEINFADGIVCDFKKL